MSTNERLDVLEIQVNGDDKNNDDYGLRGESQNHETRIKDLERDRKWISGLVMAALIAACTYFFSQLNNDNGNDNASGDHHDSNIMDNPIEYSRRGEYDNNGNNQTIKDGN